MAKEDYYKIADVSAGEFGAFVCQWQGLLSKAADNETLWTCGVDCYDGRIYPPNTDAEKVWRSTMKKIARATVGKRGTELVQIEFTCLQAAMLHGFIMNVSTIAPSLRDTFGRMFSPWFQMSKGWSRCIHEILPSFDRDELSMCIIDMERRLNVLRDSLKEFE